MLVIYFFIILLCSCAASYLSYLSENYVFATIFWLIALLNAIALTIIVYEPPR